MSLQMPAGGRVSITYTAMLTTTHHAANSFDKELWWGTLIDLLDTDLDGHKCCVREAERSALSRLQTLPKRFAMMCCPTERHASFQSASYCPALLCLPSRPLTDNFV